MFTPLTRVRHAEGNLPGDEAETHRVLVRQLAGCSFAQFTCGRLARTSRPVTQSYGNCDPRGYRLRGAALGLLRLRTSGMESGGALHCQIHAPVSAGVKLTHPAG